jgi:hypothetical protein
MEHQTFELGGFRLQHSQARIAVTVQTTIDVPQQLSGIELDAVVKSWVQRARQLAIHLEVESESPRLCQEQLRTFSEALIHSEVPYILAIIGSS